MTNPSHYLNANILESSFRDPNAQVYKLNDQIYRQITDRGIEDYLKLMSCGLYEQLKSCEYLIPHNEESLDLALNKQAKVVIKPDKIPFISYPYEWCFSQLKDAALLTLQINKIAIKYGMILKDATAYNIQFYYGKPIFIDTSSFVIYKEGDPWVGYKQFCEHFLAPLALMAKKDIRLGILTKQYINGIPLNLASSLLPIKSKLSLSLLIHLHIHAMAHKKNNRTVSASNGKWNISKHSLLSLLDTLTTAIQKLKCLPVATEWAHYYTQTNYTDKATLCKMDIITKLSEKVSAKVVFDLGSNNGFYSRAAIKQNTHIMCFDSDPMAVEVNYNLVKEKNCKSILPLMQDLVNPSSNIGWAQNERNGLKERGKADLVMALAILHHLVISNNVPLTLISDYFSSLGEYLIIEFIPKTDSQVSRLLKNREDIFHDYCIDNFRKVFLLNYIILEESNVVETCRTIFLMKRK